MVRIEALLERIATVLERQQHNCDLPDDHEGRCWFESGTDDD